MTTDVETQEADAQARLEAAEQKTAALRQTIGERLTAGESFDNEAVELAVAIAAHREVLKESNSKALSEETSQIAEMVTVMLDSSKLSQLLGETVHSMFWQRTPGSGENGPIINCSINVTARVAGTRATGAGGTGKGSRKTPTFKVDGSEPMSAADFVVAFGSAETLANSLVKLDADGKRKWASKPVFLNTTEKELTEAGRTVERIAPE